MKNKIKNKKIYIFLALLLAMATSLECARGYRGRPRRYNRGWRRSGGVGFNIGFGTGPRRYHRRPYRRAYRYSRPYVGFGFGYGYPYRNWYNRYYRPRTVYYVQDSSKKQELENRISELEEQLKQAQDTQRVRNLHTEIYETKRTELEDVLNHKEREYQRQIDAGEKKQARETSHIIQRIKQDLRDMRRDFNKMMQDLDRNPVESNTVKTKSY